MNVKKSLLATVFISLIAGFAGGGISMLLLRNNQALQSVVTKEIEERTYIEESASIDAIKKVSPSVVSIVATKDLQVFYSQGLPFNDPFFEQFFGDSPFFQFQPQPKQKQPQEKKEKQKVGGGTGFVVTSEGLIVTNAHVVADPDAEYSVVTADGAEYRAELVDSDPVNDLAFVKALPKDEKSSKKIELTPVSLGDSNRLQVGQKVLAIGYALGEFENTVTAGIVSAKGRHITASAGGGGYQEQLYGLLQVDAPINFGNSGGPLVNLKGEVIGVNVAVAQAAQGIGFAIPINDVKPLFQSVQKNGKISRAQLGVRHMILNKESAKELGIEVNYGALLVGDESKGEFAVVPGSPADKAGLKIKDVILEVDGKKITQENTLQRAIRSHQPGDTITLKVWRSGKTFEVKVKLEEVKE